jgi:cell wall-associated NlpC family hydrolase
LERVSREQAKSAGQEVEVSLKTLRPGDLLFYARGGTVNHVAIYIGNGKIVHAAGKSYGIIISDYDYRSVYKARRVIMGQDAILGMDSLHDSVKFIS